ncbi:hypothetical protein Patl1_00323 [Pistacia atlantica]|uniref:Uncharacterized protein n=1 Tax=Pistacia atlantica TaxID=434234 RepID=A0ACC1C6Q8_9ROSI|nr:hypothetical protein Patl1_00323 [Pistacia atlantica]
MAGVTETQRRQGGRPMYPSPRGPPQSRPRFEPVDREKCRLVLYCFEFLLSYILTHLLKALQIGGHHSREDFAVRGKEPKDEVQIYTWKDATLRELTDLVKEVASAARRRDARLSFAFVYPDKNGRFVLREVCLFLYKPHNLEKKLERLLGLVLQSSRAWKLRGVGKTFSYGNGRRLDDGKALAELGFEIGDYLDVAIL